MTISLRMIEINLGTSPNPCACSLRRVRNFRSVVFFHPNRKSECLPAKKGRLHRVVRLRFEAPVASIDPRGLCSTRARTRSGSSPSHNRGFSSFLPQKDGKGAAPRMPCFKLQQGNKPSKSQNFGTSCVCVPFSAGATGTRAVVVCQSAKIFSFCTEKWKFAGTHTHDAFRFPRTCTAQPSSFSLSVCALGRRPPPLLLCDDGYHALF